MRILLSRLIVLAMLLIATAAFAAPSLTWVDEASGKTLFTARDIVRFDWDRQVFELTPAASESLQALPMLPLRTFLLRADNGTIYRGAFYSPISSRGFDGPAIQLHDRAQPNSPVYRIEAWYGGRYPRTEDVRFSSRLHDALQSARVLCAIPRPAGTPPEAGDAYHGLIVRLSTEKPQYHVGEPVRFTVRETNVGTETLKFSFSHFPRFYQLLLTDANDKPVAKTAETRNAEDETLPRDEPVSIITLAPGETFSRTYDLRQYVVSLDPGVYTLLVMRTATSFEKPAANRLGDGALSFPCRIEIVK